MKILLLTDYHGYFYSAATTPLFTMDVPRLVGEFRRLGHDVLVKKFAEVRFRDTDYTDTVVLYTSQEDPDLRYKDFIEDVLLGLRERGAMLVPDFKYFRAHHNKVFMEILRDTCSIPGIRNIESRAFGTMEEYLEHGEHPLPAVIKPSAGAASRSVSLLTAQNRSALVARISRSFHLTDAVKNTVKRLLRHARPARSLHRRKFVVQNLVEGLSGVYEILVYDRDYYVLRNANRKNDFRASGSGLFSWPGEVSPGLLEFAETVFQGMDVPCVALDVAERGGEFFLIEFQAVMFGTLPLERAPFFWRRDGTGWRRIEETSVLEAAFAAAVHGYLGRKT